MTLLSKYKWYKGNNSKFWDVLTLNPSMQLCSFSVCNQGVSSDSIYMTPGHILVTNIEQWRGVSSVVKTQLQQVHCLPQRDKTYYSKWNGILQNCNIVLLNIFLCKKHSTNCGSLVRYGNKDYYKCARVYVCHLFLCAYYIVLYTLVSTSCISYKSVYQSFMIPKIFTLI